MTIKLRETDLYYPIRDYLIAQGYQVRGEVHHCDIAATKGEDELILVETKLSFNAELLIQAVERQRISDSVYVAIPAPGKGQRRGRVLGMHRLLRRLEIGLILVHFAPLPDKHTIPRIEIVFHPLPCDRKKKTNVRRAVIREANIRQQDTPGGINRRKIMTAYREQVVVIAAHLAQLGPSSPKNLRALGTGEKTGPILASNFYGWFERIARGIYALNAKGQTEYAQFLPATTPLTPEPPVEDPPPKAKTRKKREPKG